MSEHAAPFSVSDSAARRVAFLLTQESPDKFLRITVEGGGCSGFQYKFDFDDKREDDDFIVEKNGATVVIDSMSAEFMGGAELDFTEDLIGAAFNIKNPNAAASCGCGTSFSVM